MADFETFDAGRVEDIAAEGEWVLVLILDDSEASHEWEGMLEDASVAKWLENFALFLMRLETAPQQTTEAMEEWEVDEPPAILVVAADRSVLNDSRLSVDSVDQTDDIAEYLKEQVGARRGEKEDE